MVEEDVILRQRMRRLQIVAIGFYDANDKALVDFIERENVRLFLLLVAIPVILQVRRLAASLNVLRADDRKVFRSKILEQFLG